MTIADAVLAPMPGWSRRIALRLSCCCRRGAALRPSNRSKVPSVSTQAAFLREWRSSHCT